MQTLTSVVHDVEDAIGSRDAEKRIAMLRRMTDLFSAEADRISEMQVGAFDEVMVRLSTNVPTKARAELSDRLADIGLAPRNVVRDLAFDASVEVARPILERSTRLAESDLVQIAEERGQGHLYAISRRASLSESVTDVLVTRGDQAVVRSVASNEGARFSSYGFDTLTERAEHDEILEGALTGRRDVPQEHISRLAEASRARIAARLAAAGVTEVQAPAPAPRGAPANKDAALAAAVAFVEARARDAQGLGFDEQDVLAWMKDGRVLEALVAISRAAGVPIPMVMRAHQAAHYDPLLFLVRSIRYGWGTFKALLLAKSEKPPSSDTQRAAFEAFQALSVSTAQRVVRFTAVREQAQESSAA